MLRWSAESTGREVELIAVCDPEADSKLVAGRALAAAGRLGSAITAPDASAVELVASELGDGAAVDAAAVAAAFEGLNRIVDGVGLPVSRASRRDDADIIESLGLDQFPHAAQ
ncbi:MAG: hypothetical protein OEQ47_02605 [Acidimicrobiia bacterium]|nr:hypothetical protein [Acidimicrobiia bacterium]